MSGGVKTGSKRKRKTRAAADYKTRRAMMSAEAAGVIVEQKKENQKISKALLIRTLFLLTVCGVAAFLILAARLYDVQITNSSYYEARTLNSQLRETTLTASRGTIYDANNKILAMSGPVENVFISPLEMSMYEQDINHIAEGLSIILGVQVNSVIEKAGRTNSQYQVIKAKVESDEAGLVRDFIKEYNLRGIHFEPASQRYYPNDHLASQVLGFVGTDNIGLDGIEQRFDNELTGVSGRMIRLTNAKGNDLMLAGFGDILNARDGNDIKLTLNMSVQYYVEKHLSQAIIDYDILGGAMCIAINPKTGEILAMANYPTFNPNNFLQVSENDSERLNEIEDADERAEARRNAQFRQWRNQSLADSYEPGSVFKIITLQWRLKKMPQIRTAHFSVTVQ